MNRSAIYQQLEQRLITWAHTQPAIQAVIVVGSRARSVHPADEWSDLDLVIFTSDAALYLRDGVWLNTFGTVLAAISHSFGQHDREWIALYADSAKLDAAFLPIDPMTTPTLQSMLDAFPYPNVLQRGVRVLVDKTGTSIALRLPQVDTARLPDQAEFTAILNRMWLDSVKAAKFIRRNDLWRARQVCDGDLQQHLLTLLEWQAVAQSDQRDIWYDGRFMAEWADRAALAALPDTCAAFDRADLARALWASLDLFRKLAKEVAQRLKLMYPDEVDRSIADLIHSMLSGAT
jgi:aminoglycoside 6-adenylyltransferase